MSQDKNPTVAEGATSERRGLLKGAGLGAAALALGGLGFTSRPAKADVTDVDVLNFALNLEYLEAEFYMLAAFGQHLSPDDQTGTVGAQGPVYGGRKVAFKDKFVMEYAREIALDERAHVRFLRSALGSAKIAQPLIDLAHGFNKLAHAAGLVTGSEIFDPFLNDTNFLLAAFVFEDVGVTAYHGAAPLLTNPAYLSAAAGILAVEAYHAAIIRTKLYEMGLQLQAQKISDLRRALSGANDDQGVVNPPFANIVPTDANGIAFARTTTQVLNIVYGGGAANGYLFFPNKVNGTIS